MRLTDTFKKSGALPEGKVHVDISYDIIRAVSSQLYTSPRKAIEELICNAYDAGAHECRVKIPNIANDPLIVIDNGKSMDFDGLRDLWHVARSPKMHGSNDLRIANDRMQIGKFGVGKLAAFALGKRLTHVTCVKNAVRIISVGQNEIRDKPDRGAPAFQVYRLPLSKAKSLLTPLLSDLPKPWVTGWRTWTLAMVEEVDSRGIGGALRIELLKKMIDTALPVSTKFQVFLEGDLVPRREISRDRIAVSVDLLDPKFRERLAESLHEFWADRLDLDLKDVPRNRYALTVDYFPNPEQASKPVKALVIPELGHVFGEAIFAKTSLTTEKLKERSYSDNGFAVTAYGKLINPEDPLFGIRQPPHKYWSKFHAHVEIPGLDKVLLVQRNAISETSPEAEIARQVLHTLFYYTRGLVEEQEETGEYDPGSFGQRLGSSAPIHAQAALKGLLRGAVASGDLGKLKIDFGNLGIAGPAARFNKDALTLVINEDHPLLSSLEELGNISKQMRRVIGEVLAGIEIGKGYFLARGVDEEIISEAAEVIDASLRSAADFVRDPVEEHIKEIKNASYTGDTPFEKAVVEAFRSLRLAANHHGESDQPDGIIEIPISGMDNLRVSIEAKGSKGIITHKELREATVSRHSGEAQCHCAVAIAREFATGGIGGKDSALLRETSGKVPLLTVEGIERMLRLHKVKNFTYDKVIKILTTWTHPDTLVAFIEDTWHEMPELGLMRLILTVAHDLSVKDSTNPPSLGGIVADNRIIAKKIKTNDVNTVLHSVAITTGMITILSPGTMEFQLNAPVETILQAMQADFDIASGVRVTT